MSDIQGKKCTTMCCADVDVPQVKNDKLDLRVPVWITDLQFMDPSETSKIIVGTGHHQVLFTVSRANN
jgi:hypothetical protein